MAIKGQENLIPMNERSKEKIKMKLDINLFGSRGASSGRTGGGSNNKYNGRFAGGTNEQLQQAKRNLEFKINRLNETISSQEYYNKIAKGQVSYQLNFNKNSLKEIKSQYQELKREFKKRKLKF